RSAPAVSGAGPAAVATTAASAAPALAAREGGLAAGVSPALARAGAPRARLLRAPARLLLRLPLRLRLGLGAGALAVLRLAAADLGDPLADRDLEALLRPRRVVEPLHLHARDRLPHRALDRPEVLLLVRGDQGVGVARSVRAGGA